MEISFLMLGGNIGDRIEYLSRCIELLRSNVGRIVTMSSVYESEPWGFDDSLWFLNQVIAVETDLTPNDLLGITQNIEKQLGRCRTNETLSVVEDPDRGRYNKMYNSRTIDIDILLYGDVIINTPSLEIPHPRINDRMFVLQPMATVKAQISVLLPS